VGTGHRGKNCTWLTAALLETPEGQRSLRDSGITVPSELQDAVRFHRNYLRFVLQYQWPLRQACIYAKKLYFNEMHEDTMDALGRCVEREFLINELGNLPMYDHSWTLVQLVKRVNEHRSEKG
jgi:hypothetical protein